jgi:Polyketide cyclase / dehydrase and lipid transport
MSRGVHVQESVEIARPPGEVWSAIADYGFDRAWRRGLTDMTPDPPGGPAIGTRVHEVLRSSGREYVADTVVTSVEPGVAYQFTGSGSIGGLRGGRSVHATRDGTSSVFTYDIRLEPKGRMRLLGPLLGPIVRTGLKRDLKTLRALLEDD